jgi:MoaA/NifB/PqqE/SkfB family radical SAM enzyme
MPECFAYKSHLALDINGYRVPCCMYRSLSIDDPLVSHHWTDISLDEYRNLPEYQNLKTVMESGKWHPGCRECQKSENLGNSSLRLGNNQLIKHKKEDNDNIEFIEISLGNDCNLSCRMCAPNFSTDYIKRIEKNPTLLNFVDFGNTDCQRISYGVEQMFDPVDLSNLKSIKYIGGEPFITPQVGKLFSYLDKKVNLENVNLFTNTNATFFPEKYIKYLTKFKNVFMCISIDGIGERDDYIREGSIWNEKINIIQKYKDLGFNVSGHTVLNALNIDQVAQLEDFGHKNFEAGFPPHFTICTNPEHLSLNALPIKYVKTLCKQKPEVRKYFKNYAFSKEKFTKLKKFIKEFDNTTNKRLKDYIPLLDKHLT